MRVYEVDLLVPRGQANHPESHAKSRKVLLPKENLLNVEGRIFFSELASRRIQYLKQNYLINTTIQKASIASFLGCLGHNSISWQ